MNYVFRINGEGAVTAEQISELKRRCTEWNDDAPVYFENRTTLDDMRRNVWAGQSGDGRHWDRIQKDKPRGIFNGAADSRMRMADDIIKSKANILIGALSLANINFTGTGDRALQMRDNLSTLFGWMRDNMESSWIGAWMQLIMWYLADSPAVAMMKVEWRKDSWLGKRKVTMDELAQAWLAREVSRVQGDPRLAVEAEQMVAGKVALLQLAEDNEETDSARGEAEALLEQMTGADSGEARRKLKKIFKDGQADVVAEMVANEGVKLTPQRYGQDFVVADDCRDFRDFGMWFSSRWMTLEEIDSQKDWDEDFKEAVKSQGGAEVMDNGIHATNATDTVYRQVVYAYVVGLDSKGRKGKYVCVFGQADNLTAEGWKLVEGASGRWPGVLFRREFDGMMVLDSRGVTEIVSADEGLSKCMMDGAANNAMIGNLPPVISKGHSLRNQLISPLKNINMGVNDSYSFMQPPAYPASTKMVKDTLDIKVKDYFGVRHKDADPTKVATTEQAEVSLFLSSASEVIRRMIEVCQESASDQYLARVTDDAGAPARMHLADIEGQFLVSVTMDPSNMDPKKLAEKGQVISQLLPSIDKAGIIDTSPIARELVTNMFPGIGGKLVKKEAVAMQDELQDEAKNYALIRSGVMPVMNTQGLWNYQARLGMYEQMRNQNPAVFSDMAPDKAMMLDKWLEAMEQQMTQFGENKQIGRTGVEGVTG
jgi:hypothetical protein